MAPSLVSTRMRWNPGTTFTSPSTLLTIMVMNMAMTMGTMTDWVK